LTWAGASSFGPGVGSSAIVIDDDGHIVPHRHAVAGLLTNHVRGHRTDTQNGGNTGTVPQTLINESVTFDGYATMGNGHAGSLTLTNQAAGTYDADNSADAFIFDTGNTITNAGLFEATGGATLEFESTVANNPTAVNNVGGTVQAGAGSEVELLNAKISGGTVSTAATGTIVGNGTSAIDNAVINNTGTIETGGTFTLDGDTINGGTLTGIAAGDIYNVDSGKTLTLNGITALGSVSGATGTVDNAGTIALENTLTLGGTNFTLALDDAAWWGSTARRSRAPAPTPRRFSTTATPSSARHDRGSGHYQRERRRDRGGAQSRRRAGRSSSFPSPTTAAVRSTRRLTHRHDPRCRG